MQKGEGADPEVTWEDQQNINKFGRLNNRLHELDDEIKGKKDYLENIEDASNELILCDDDTVRYMAGEVFLHTDKDDVEGQLEALRERTSGEVAALEGEKSSLVAQMAELKVVLWGEQEGERTSGEVAALEGEKSSLVAQMGALKVVLYGKFKDAINLED
ncbi:unnamed protein product [Closterium sp. Naga37s-1]|nr:unnamed protein product [Closterium sp. Naga37s-1]